MTRNVRLLIAAALSVACCGVVGWVFAGNTHAADAEVSSDDWQPAFPVYPGARMLPMVDDGNLNGQPFNLGYFSTAAAPGDVVRFYESYWRAHHFLVDGEAVLSGGRLTALDDADGTLRTIAVRREGERAVVFCSVMPSGQVKAAAQLPAPPDVIIGDSISMGTDQTLTYVGRGTLDERRAQLEDFMAGRGWKPLADRSKPLPLGLSLEFEQPGQIAHAILRTEPDGKSVAVQLHVARNTEEPR